ncbi:hypothetical protein L6452_39910 [Arctium lappa]|uniref:Uncharacterized protein n=1 Tax=Arctium lappa TaxID=4217 RepID=A0ACB8XTK8_ARCLA|nr:hypothetical protein L6452_39910 [Arctium lappa]
MVLTSVFRSRRPLRLKTSSAEDVLGRRHLRKPKISQSSEAEDFLVLGAEDLSVLRAEDLSVFGSPKISDKASFVYYTILRKGLYHPSAGQHLKPKHLKTKGTSCTLYLAEDLCPSLLKTCVLPY